MNIECPISMLNVSRSHGQKPVVHDLSLQVSRGSIYGFLGRNGTGKTTTMRMLAGLTRPEAGEVRILGIDPFTMSGNDRARLGYMSENAALPGHCSVKRALQLCRDLCPEWDSALADGLISKYGLNPSATCTSLSQGQQRLLAFVMAIAPRPSVLLLDEPAANLDVVARREILDDILELVRSRNCTVLFSTHVLSDVERVANEVGILAGGKLLVSESLDDLKDSVVQAYFFDFNGPVPSGDIPANFRAVNTGKDLTLTLRESQPRHIETLASHWKCKVKSRPLNLEDIFVELTR